MTSSPEWFAHPTAVVDQPVEIGRGTKIWHFCHVSAKCTIGEGCNFGQNVFVASGVRIGRNVKVQNNVSLYGGTIVEDDVFLGPSCVLTNVTNPRSQVNRREIYEATVIRRGATIGANATIVCGTTVGRYAFIAAGAVVTSSVPDYALIAGVPGRRIGWMSRHGHRLEIVEGETARCAESGYRYELRQGVVHCLDLDEEAPLPADKAVGEKPYDAFKKLSPR
jgi:UDP-2-acetamido-3-amino-2,3-dideoxy-glucuronate N-acetyltransferase